MVLNACCTVCGSAGGHPVCRRGRFELVKCGCGAIYLNPPVPQGAVDPTHDSHPESFYALAVAMKLRWLGRSHPQGRLLEVGCGNGHFLRAAQSAGYQVSGIELHAARAQKLSQQLGVVVESGAIEETQWPARSCDIVYHCDLLSHFPQPLLALQQMARLLREDGVLFFEVGLFDELAPIWYGAVTERSIPRHRWFYSEAALVQLLAQAGLRVLRMKRFGLGPQILVYNSLSRVVQTARLAVRQAVQQAARQAPTGSRWRATAPRLAAPWWAARAAPSRQERQESRWEGGFNHFMRFRVGALFPHWGPGTAWVIAGRSGASKAQ